MIHLPHQDQDKEGYGYIDMDERFKFLIDSTKIMWNNLPIQSNIPAGYAWYHVKDTVCSSLGDVGNLCADYTHAQEGLGCQMLGWVTALWILRHIGYPTGVLNDPLQISTAIYQSFDVPGPNLGSGVVVGSTEQYRAAQQLAANAFKECDAIFGTQKAKTSDLDNDAGFVKEDSLTDYTVLSPVHSHLGLIDAEKHQIDTTSATKYTINVYRVDPEDWDKEWYFTCRTASSEKYDAIQFLGLNNAFLGSYRKPDVENDDYFDVDRLIQLPEGTRIIWVAGSVVTPAIKIKNKTPKITHRLAEALGGIYPVFDWKGIPMGLHRSMYLNDQGEEVSSSDNKDYVGIFVLDDMLPSGKIKVSGSNPTQSSSYPMGCFFDKNDTLISTFRGSSATSSEVEMDVPSNATYLKLYGYHPSVPAVSKQYLRYTCPTITQPESGKVYKFLFAGNSVDQDCITYVPYILQKIAPDFKFKMVISYTPSLTLRQHLTQVWQPNVNLGIASTWNSGDTQWTCSTTTKLSELLANDQFDVISLQEYFNWPSKRPVYTDSDYADYEDAMNYMRERQSGAFIPAFLMHAAGRTGTFELGTIDHDAINQTLIESAKVLVRSSSCAGIIPCGLSIENALHNDSLKSLGSWTGGTSPGQLTSDGIHAQEGIPSIIQAMVIAEWIFNRFGLPYSINNSQINMTKATYDTLNIPGPNGSFIVSSADLYREAEKEC